MVQTSPNHGTFAYYERFQNALHLMKRRQFYSNISLYGCISYATFNLHVSTSRGLTRYIALYCAILQVIKIFAILIRFGTWCGPGLCRIILLHSHLGVGLYLYRSNFLKTQSESRKIIYSCYLSTIFNLGSILFIVATKNFLPNWDSLRGLYSLIASYMLISVGTDLLSSSNQLANEINQ